MDIREAYQAVQEAMGFKIGQKVKVVGQHPSYACGWQNVWVEQMNKAIGEIATITNVGHTGIRLTHPDMDICYNYPCYVLQKVEQKVTVKLNSEYEATHVIGDEHVTVGCQKIPLAKIRELLKEIDLLTRKA